MHKSYIEDNRDLKIEKDIHSESESNLSTKNEKVISKMQLNSNEMLVQYIQLMNAKSKKVKDNVQVKGISLKIISSAELENVRQNSESEIDDKKSELIDLSNISNRINTENKNVTDEINKYLNPVQVQKDFSFKITKSNNDEIYHDENIDTLFFFSETKKNTIEDEFSLVIEEIIYYLHGFKVLPKLSVYFTRDKENISRTKVVNLNKKLELSPMNVINIRELIEKNQRLKFDDIIERSVLRSDEFQGEILLKNVFDFEYLFESNLKIELKRIINNNFTFCENIFVMIKTLNDLDVNDSEANLDTDIKQLNIKSLSYLLDDFSLENCINTIRNDENCSNKFNVKSQLPDFIFGFFKKDQINGEINDWIERRALVEEQDLHKRFNLKKIVQLTIPKKSRIDDLGFFFENDLDSCYSFSGKITYYDFNLRDQLTTITSINKLAEDAKNYEAESGDSTCSEDFFYERKFLNFREYDTTELLSIKDAQLENNPDEKFSLDPSTKENSLQQTHDSTKFLEKSELIETKIQDVSIFRASNLTKGKLLKALERNAKNDRIKKSNKSTSELIDVNHEEIKRLKESSKLVSLSVTDEENEPYYYLEKNKTISNLASKSAFTSFNLANILDSSPNQNLTKSDSTQSVETLEPYTVYSKINSDDEPYETAF